MPAWPFKGAVVQTAFMLMATASFLRLRSRLFRGGRRRGGGGSGRRWRCVTGRGRGRCRCGGGRRLRLGARIDPAGMDAVIEAPWHLVVDLAPEPGQAAEARLDMAARAAEPVIEVEMAEGSIEVVQPHQADHAATEPDAFRIAGRAVDGLLGLDEFGRLALVFLDRIGGFAVRGVLLVLGGRAAALGEDAAGPDQESHGNGQDGRGKVTQDDTMKLEYPATHTFPDWLNFPAPRPGARV